MKILYLTLKKKWFDLIFSGEKKVEYREMKPYWNKRLKGGWDYIQFVNGYGKHRPYMRIKFEGMYIDRFQGKMCHALRLGEIVDCGSYQKGFKKTDDD